MQVVFNKYYWMRKLAVGRPHTGPSVLVMATESHLTPG